MSRRNTKKPPRDSSLRAVIESLETRAMLAGVGPESWSASGLAPAPLGTGSLSSSGIILTCSSPAPGSCGAASPPAPAAGSGGTTSGGDLWDSFSVGSGAGGSKSGSTGGVSTDGPALSSQYTGGSGAGKGSGTSSGSSGTTSGGDLWDSFSVKPGTGGSTSGSTGGVSTNGPALSSQYTGGSGAGKGSGTSSGSGTTSGGDLWDSFSAGSRAGGSTSGSTGGVSTDGPALSSQYNGGSGGGGQGNGTVGTLSNADLWRLYWSGAGAGSSSGPADGSLANDPTISAQYTGGSGGGLVFFVTGATGAGAANSGSQQGSTGSTTLTLADGQSPVMTTPLVYQPGSDDGPGVVSGVWTGGDGGWQVILMSDGENSYDDGAPDGEPQGDPWPLRLPGVTGFSQFKSMGEPGWGDDVPVFRPGDVEAARGLTGLAKMVHDHGLPVSRRAADSNGRVVVYTFTDGTTYMEPVEPPSEQYIDSAAVMVPGGIALSRGKGLSGAARAIAAEAIDDAATSRASQAANVVTGGYLKWIPAPIASILFGGKPKPHVSGVVDDAAEAAKDAGTLATKSADDVAEAAGRGAATAAPQSTVRVYRVEGAPNSHVAIGEGGVVAIKQGNKTIFFNFGSRARAEQYLSQKLDPMQKLGPVPGATVRSFEVPESFLEVLPAF